MRLYIYPPTAVSVTVPPIAYTNGGINTPVTPSSPLPVFQKNELKSFAILDFATDNVADSAWVELLDTVGTDQIKKAQIFMSSGNALYIGYGAIGLESEQGIITPGGNGAIDLSIPANTRISVKAIGTGVTVSSGMIYANFLG